MTISSVNVNTKKSELIKICRSSKIKSNILNLSQLRMNFIPETVLEESDEKLIENNIEKNEDEKEKYQKDKNKFLKSNKLPSQFIKILGLNIHERLIHSNDKKFEMQVILENYLNEIDKKLNDFCTFYAFFQKRSSESVVEIDLDSLRADEIIHNKRVMIILCEIKNQIITFKYLIFNLLNNCHNVHINILNILNKFVNILDQSQAKNDEFLSNHKNYEEISSLVKMSTIKFSSLQHKIIMIDKNNNIMLNSKLQKNVKYESYRKKIINLQRILHIEKKKAKLQPYQKYTMNTLTILNDYFIFFKEVESLYIRNSKLFQDHELRIEIFTELVVNMISLQKLHILLVLSKKNLYEYHTFIYQKLKYLYTSLQNFTI